MTAKQRTLLAIGLFVPLAAILLVTIACLPVPVGDPAQSKVDDKLIGAWQQVPTNAEDKGTVVAVMRPLDEHSYYVQYLSTEMKDGQQQTSVLNFRGWLTTLGGATFITCESLDNSDFLTAGKQQDRYYWVAKVQHTGDILTVAVLDENSDFIKELKTREQIEAAIKANVDKKELYNSTLTFNKLDKDHVSLVDDLRQRAKVGMR